MPIPMTVNGAESLRAELAQRKGEIRQSIVKDIAEARAHEALDAGNGLGGVGDGLTLRGFTHFALTTVDEGHHRRGGALAFTVVDDHRFVAFHHCHAAVGCPEVNANDFAHVEKLEWLILTSPDQIRCQQHFPVPSVPS